MALLICPECNGQVSDKAEYCLQCGFPVKDMMTTEITNTKTVKKSKKKILLIALALLFVSVVAVMTTILVTRPDHSGLYQKNAWGSSLEEIKKKYPKGEEKKGEEDENKINYLYEMKPFIDGINASVSFSFQDDGLNQITIVPTTLQEDSDIVEMEIPSKIKAYLCDLYGEYTTEGSTYKTYKWKTKKSDIELMAIDQWAIIKYMKKGLEDEEK